MPPPGLYQRSKDLEVYFDGNPDIWFAGDRYGPWLVQLREMGVRQAVEVRARTPGDLGYVPITVEFGRNERGLGGFDPDAEIDGLDFALRHPNHARSEYVWNVLLAPNRRLVAGVVERSVLASFGDSSQENARSAIAAVAEREAWLPGRDGTFLRPGELSLDDLPPAYAREEGLAHALNMLQPVVTEAARQLGIAPEVLWGLNAHPEPGRDGRAGARAAGRRRNWSVTLLGRHCRGPEQHCQRTLRRWTPAMPQGKVKAMLRTPAAAIAAEDRSFRYVRASAGYGVQAQKRARARGRDTFSHRDLSRWTGYPHVTSFG